MVATTLLVLLQAYESSCHAAAEDYRSGAIKTVAGYVLVWNQPDNWYRLKSKVKMCAKHQPSANFSVDGMFLQVLTLRRMIFLKGRRNQSQTIKPFDGSEIGSKVFESTYKERRNVESSLAKVGRGKEGSCMAI